MPTFQFDASTVEPTQPKSFDPLPDGDYEMMITKSDVKPTKSGTGHYIELEMQVVSGQHSGRRHWERLNVSNPNKQAEDIAKANLAAICKVIGLESIEETEQLHDAPFVAEIQIDRKDATRNRIVGYLPAFAKPAPAAAAAPATNKKPWA